MNAGYDMNLDAEQIYYKISELSVLLGVEPSVLRFWEKEFSQIRPLKVGPRKRLYRRRDLEIFQEIKRLLYDERFTIVGAKKRLLRHDSRQGELFFEDDDKIRAPLLAMAVTPADELRVARAVIDDARQELMEIKDILLKGRASASAGDEIPAKPAKKSRSAAPKTPRVRKKKTAESAPLAQERLREPDTSNIFNEPLILTPEPPGRLRPAGKKTNNESD